MTSVPPTILSWGIPANFPLVNTEMGNRGRIKSDVGLAKEFNTINLKPHVCSLNENFTFLPTTETNKADTIAMNFILIIHLGILLVSKKGPAYIVHTEPDHVFQISNLSKKKHVRFHRCQYFV